MKREIMNKRIDTAIQSALSVANLVADALISPQLAVEIVQQPQQIAAKRGLDTPGVIASARIVEQGKKSVGLTVWW